MKKIFAVVVFGICTFSVNAEQGLPDFTKLVELNSPSVVNISTTRKLDASDFHGRLPDGIEIPNDPDNPLGEFLRRFFGDNADRYLNRETHSLGSGFIISEDGYVVTNNHVVRGADEIIVKLSDRRELEAKVIGTDPRSDIALLKIEAKKLPVAKLGNAEALKVGEWVLAIGSPFGFEHSVTAGIVSAKGRSLPNENYVPFIQTDVAINPGNSGGPLFNLKGQVVGVNSQIYSRTGGFMGLSFAIPIDVALNVVDQLKQKGYVSRGWLGVLIQEVTRDLAESFRMGKPYGALVSKILNGSPAANADIKVGDVIIEFNGEEIKNSATLPPMVGKVATGDSVNLKVLRDGRIKEVAVKIGELPKEDNLAIIGDIDQKSKSSARFGLELQELDEQLKKEFQIESGVLVVGISSGPGRDAGLQKGDIIARINNRPVDNVEDFIKKLDVQLPGASMALFVLRRQGPLFLALKIPGEK